MLGTCCYTWAKRGPGPEIGCLWHLDAIQLGPLVLDRVPSRAQKQGHQGGQKEGKVTH